jgi:hypothetical protein
VINRVVSFAGCVSPAPALSLANRPGRFAVNKVTELPLARRFAPTAVGLLSIPLIIAPIDHAVDRAMDELYRPLVRSQLGSSSKE